jgi:uncharacterized protein YbaR (Trm112 family)
VTAELLRESHVITPPPIPVPLIPVPPIPVPPIEWDADLLRRLACPACRGALGIEDARLVCTACRQSYSFAGGIPRLIAARSEA